MVFCYQTCSDRLLEKESNDREKVLKFQAEGREFAKFLRSLEQFIQTVKGRNGFDTFQPKAECIRNLKLILN